MDKTVIHRQIKRTYSILFHMTMFFMIVDWLYPQFTIIGFIGAYEITFGLMCGALFLWAIREKKALCGRAVRAYRDSRIIVISLVCYLVLGLITVFYSQDKAFLLSRYFVAIQMLVFCVAAICYVFQDEANIEKRIRSIIFSIGISGWLCAVFSVIGYLLNAHTAYIQRVSPIRDYNQYATILLVGFLAMAISLITVKKPARWKSWLSIPLLAVFVVTCYEAVSRRTAILMLAIGIVLILIVLANTWRSFRRDRQIRRLGHSLLILACCAVVALFSTQLFHQITQETYLYRLENRIQPGTGITGDQLQGDLSEYDFIYDLEQKDHADGTYATILTGEAGRKRSVIWAVAMEHIKNGGVVQWLVGHGAGYDSLIYDDLNDPMVQTIVEAYHMKDPPAHWMNSHNLLFQNFLEGGAVLTAALLFLGISLLVSAFNLLKKSFLYGVFISGFYIIVFVNVMLSPSMGLVYNKFFWIAVLLHVLINRMVAKTVAIPEKEAGYVKKRQGQIIDPQ